MEFLRLLCEAETLGFSRDEFKAIWEKEMAIKEMALRERNQIPDSKSCFSETTQAVRPQAKQVSDPTRQHPADFGSSLATNTQQIRELQTVAQSLQQQLTSLRTDLLNQNREALDTVIVPGYGQIKQELEKIRAQLAVIKQENVTLKSELVSQQTILKKLIENTTFDLKHELEKDIKQLMIDVVHQYTVASKEQTDAKKNDRKHAKIQNKIKLGKWLSLSELNLTDVGKCETVIEIPDTNQENCLLVKSVPECCRGCGQEWTTFKSTWELTNLPSTTCQYSDYIKPKHWPVSLRFGSWFDLKGKLKVYVDVSETQSCTSPKWPLAFKIYGVIHNGSKTSILWEKTITFSQGDASPIQEIPLNFSASEGMVQQEVTYELLQSEQYISVSQGIPQLAIDVYLQVKEAGTKSCQTDLRVAGTKPCQTDLQVKEAGTKSCQTDLQVKEAGTKSCQTDLRVAGTKPCQTDLQVKEAGTKPCQTDLQVKEAGTKPCQTDDSTSLNPTSVEGDNVNNGELKTTVSNLIHVDSDNQVNDETKLVEQPRKEVESTSDTPLNKAESTSDTLLNKVESTSDTLVNKDDTNILLNEAEKTSETPLDKAESTSDTLVNKDDTNILLNEAEKTSETPLNKAESTSDIPLNKAESAKDIPLNKAKQSTTNLSVKAESSADHVEQPANLTLGSYVCTKVPNVRDLYQTKGDFLAPPLYCKKLNCDIIFQVSFRSNGSVAVGLCFSPRDTAATPHVFYFNSYGFIRHSTSNSYTKLWHVTNVKRKFPEISLTNFEPYICLQTARNEYFNITYQQLAEKGYVGKDSFELRWCFEVKQLAK
ncbi:uncharacterized protein LOC131939624 isoform X2 [Physella acuta]|uniref:uncharacterized protein LOC131939624 isoform X2 n=1 Tax=Physella acuta TaxID=109671 RepID=UPI0027DB4973|nr:uncharacterized protein LOC131939624 isoform X2 [Physella acuta]